MRRREHRLAGAGVADEDDALAVIDPGSFGERGDRGLGGLGVVGEAELLQALDRGEAGFEQPAAFSALSAFGHFGLQERGKVGGRGLLLAGRFGGHRPEAGLDGRQLQLGGVRLDRWVDE